MRTTTVYYLGRKMAGSSNIGIKVSQAGKDVEDAGDSELMFSSSWPIPKILFQGRIRSYTTVNPQPIINHNLGYVPMFIPYDSNDTIVEIFREIISVDKNNIYYSSPGGIPGAFDIGLYIFDVDIEKNFQAPNIDTGTSSSTGVDRNFGIKLSKIGKDFDSDDLRDFIIHSSTRTPMIHAVSNGAPNDTGSVPNTFGNYVYEHTLPYDPLFLAYARSVAVPGAYTLVNNFADLITNGKIITIKDLTLANDPRASIVVLKDPFQINDPVVLT